jgi:hypothetical protein
MFRISAVLPYAGLHRFPEGREYKQWTGNDSKALMKVRYGLHQLLLLTTRCAGLHCCHKGACPQ